MKENLDTPSVGTPWMQRRDAQTFVLSLHVQPGAKRTAVVGLYGEKLKIALAAPPVDGKANQALVQFLAKSLGIAKSSVTILSGETNREKRVAVRCGEEALAALSAKAE